VPEHNGGEFTIKKVFAVHSYCSKIAILPFYCAINVIKNLLLHKLKETKMKNYISIKLFNVLVLSLFFMLSTSLSIIGQERELDSELLVYFLPDSLEMPGNTTELTDMAKLIINSKSLSNTMGKIGISKIKKAFPSFRVVDTIKILQDGTKIKLPNMSRIFKLKLKNKNNIENTIKLLEKEKSVLFAERNGYAMPGSTIPNDTYFNYQWGLKNGTTGRDIHATQAWDIYKGNSNNIIAIIDGGIDKTHPDLNGKVGGDNGYGWDGHGIHVAGIAAAISNNDKGVSGVDWYAKLNAQRIDNADDVGIYNAIVDAVNYSSNVRVLNNSWTLVKSQYDHSPRYSTTVRLAFTYAYKMNRVAVCANGNYQESYPNQTYYPAGFGQGIIAVGATDNNDNIASFSQRNNAIDVSAPGVHILSTYRNGNFPDDPDYHYDGGTSMAAPFVSGIASLLKGYNTSLSNDDIENIIKISADDVNSSSYPGWDQYLGTGRVNARKALDLLRSPYVLSHKSANGGSVYSSTGSFGITFYGVSGLADGYYIVKRYEVRKSVSFGYTTDTHVWGRGVGTNGFSKASPNYGMGYCDVVSYNNSSATLRTYVYQVWNVAGEYLGYYPTTPSNVHFEYTVLGKNEPLSVYITGPSYLNGGQTGTWTAHPSGGRTPYHYHWEYYVFCDGIENFGDINPDNVPCGYWFDFGGDSPTASRSDWRSFKVKVTVTDANNSTAEAYKTVTVGEGNMQERNNFEKTGVAEEIPTTTKLLNNYPNPFNPTTVIKYQLKEPAYVSLRVYDVLGKEVAELVNERKSAGYYSVNFDGSKLPSGLYIYRLQANNYVESKKMLLTK